MPFERRPAVGYAMVLVAAALFAVNGTVSKVVLSSGLSSLRNNVIVDSPQVNWPKGNFFAKNAELAGLAKTGGSDEDYRLLSGSRYRGKGTDEKRSEPRLGNVLGG